MSFLDRYEFEQILDEDLAVSRNQWQDETANNPQPQLSLAPRLQTRIWRTILIGSIATSLGFSVMHHPSLAQRPQVPGDAVAMNIQQK